ncbi:hypothetical protein AAX29_01349 [Aliarcobacter thereius]|uniref:Uncharacterized protein n=1 Tax=Aliarcobacter thereius TaxID=544718 RepID=A0A1C0B6A4_9BACT|nr:hypothetical protein [Aliarcobacter thereius]OCL98839.1 hypothetical protein AAX29_01349 [Aliarcobacter thereius]
MREIDNLLYELERTVAVIELCSGLLVGGYAKDGEIGYLLENLATRLNIETEKLFKKEELYVEHIYFEEIYHNLHELKQAVAVIELCSRLVILYEKEDHKVAYLLENLAAQLNIETEKLYEKVELDKDESIKIDFENI